MAKRIIRGVPAEEYARLMHKVERGETTEEKLVRSGKLLPSTRDGNRGINRNRDNKVFRSRSTIRGRQRHANECLVPHCDNEISRRGLCNTHRSYAYMMIKKGKTTEANLLRRRLLLPKASGGDQRRFSKKKKKKKTLKRKKSSKKKARKKKSKKKKKKKKKTSKRKTPKRVKKKTQATSLSSIPDKLIESDVCLYPGCKTTRKGGGRGLCTKHYSQYKRKRKKLSDRARRKLDKDLIKRRLLLPAKARVRKRSENIESSAFEIGSTIRGSIKRW